MKREAAAPRTARRMHDGSAQLEAHLSLHNGQGCPTTLERKLAMSLRKYVSRRRGRGKTDSYNTPTSPEQTGNND